MKNIFKKGDKVYNGVLALWGKVMSTDINVSKKNSLYVKYSDNSYAYHTSDGRALPHQSKVLSFTKYNFVKGGFSQVRPKEKDLKKGMLIFVMNECSWEMRYFSHIEGEQIFTFQGQEKEGDTVAWKEYSLTNPLADM